MSKLHDIAGQAACETALIAAERLIEGAPVTQTRLDYQSGERLFAGEWSADRGAWCVAYDEWEFCHILEGVCELTPDADEPRRYQAGDSFVIEPGFSGIWRVLEPMRKRFVVVIEAV